MAVAFHKLVRDRIPAIIENQGERPLTRRLGDAEYRACLERKLAEETAEYLEGHELDELADILEVVYALCKAGGHSLSDLAAAYEKKHAAMGGFDERIFLISKE